MTDTEILDYLDQSLAALVGKQTGLIADMNIGHVHFTIGPMHPKGSARELLCAAIERDQSIRSARTAKKLTNG